MRVMIILLAISMYRYGQSQTADQVPDPINKAIESNFEKPREVRAKLMPFHIQKIEQVQREQARLKTEYEQADKLLNARLEEIFQFIAAGAKVDFPYKIKPSKKGDAIIFVEQKKAKK